ncbi:MAG: dethiobiotin synthase [Undibacterium sp.]|nr:dethiobiotin synthase [Undibacterium sp.]
MSLAKQHFFITGTDTEIGKTFVTSALLLGLAQQGLSTVGMKPIAAGAELLDGVWHNEDVESLIAAASVKVEQQLVVPYLFHTACAPHIAAQRENAQIELPPILRSYGRLCELADVVLVEGVGGFCVPLSAQLSAQMGAQMSTESVAQLTTVDLAQALALPVIMVVGMRLGCINHALLTAQAIAASGLKLHAWVANTVDAEMAYFDENVQALSQHIAAPCLGVIPRIPQLALQTRAQGALAYLDLNFLK